MKNLIILIGNTGAEIDIKTFDDGNVIGRLSLATNETFTNAAGEKVTKTQWHTVIFRNKQAEIIEKYVKKGDQLSVDGKVEYRKYTDSNGIERYTTEIIVRDFTFLNNK